MITTLYNPVIKEEGKIEAKIEDIFDLLEEYGHPDEHLISKIKSETKLEVLKKWFKLAVKVNSIEEFVSKMDN